MHRAIITHVALVKLAKLTGLPQMDWRGALDGFADHIQTLREADETDEARRQFELILRKVEAFCDRMEGRASPVFRAIRIGKEDA